MRVAVANSPCGARRYPLQAQPPALLLGGRGRGPTGQLPAFLAGIGGVGEVAHGHGQHLGNFGRLHVPRGRRRDATQKRRDVKGAGERLNGWQGGQHLNGRPRQANFLFGFTQGRGQQRGIGRVALATRKR
nr:hypothetical protein [Tanacetum cinerariifolium]